jgi:GntR family transcriptional repressor for pyruvate dehydrogenase complex
MSDPFEAIAGERETSGASDDLGLTASRSANAIVNRLKNAIETGVFSDGDQLPPERQLAISLGTARSTIRKALDQLEARGLVVRRVGSGTFVNYAGPILAPDADVADLISPMQLIEARFAVEPSMTRLAAIHANRRDLDSFEAVLQSIEACGADQDQFTHWDMEFHLQLARCSRNPLLLKVYQQINSVRANAQWSRMKRVILTPAKIAAYNVQHREIFDALSHRDSQGAVDAIAAHLETARQDLIGAEAA